ncbi:MULTISPECIES: hypothetical protein [Prochlorococcus]|uniref:hypothetical protein n=1 Tax=Prochlorococcus TaxID=1218 RepID=UPI000A6D99EC|nr:MULTISPECIES: hypothetical protein [Prochlorococcus]NMO85405.1 hypothetical protein [Prochlorococcus sp. P1344]NMP05407.1 hypothetical protein [Prochlorococcus sp. P1361]NMP13815.1 hypothetical protein [Prochlorococcus sp.P1363]
MQRLRACCCLYCLERPAGGSDLSSVGAAILAIAVGSVAQEKAISEAVKGEEIWNTSLRRVANFC